MKIVLSKVLSLDDLKIVKDLLCHAKWEDGRLSAGAQAVQVKANLQLPKNVSEEAEIQSLVLAGLNRHPLFLSAALPRKILRPRINRYDAQNQSYGKHIDNALRLMRSAENEYVRTDISCTVFLNPPCEYEGGELVFEDSFQRNVVKLEAGDAILYPGNTVHEVTPVTQGYRHACFLWIQSFVKSAIQREMLYQLDTNLISIQDRIGDFQESVALTGLYHNLLREWSET